MGVNIINIILKIRQFVNRGMVKKFNSQSIPIESNYTLHTTYFGSRNKYISFDSETPFEISSARIPQTRIYHFVAENSFFSVTIIEYFDIIILVFENKEDSPSLKINIHKELYINGLKNQSETILNLSTDSIYLISKDRLFEKLDKIPAFLNNIYDNEINFHPLRHIKTRNPNLLNKIDNNWALMKPILKNRTLELSDYFFWIQEIYLHFNWNDKLNDFYAKYSNENILSLDYFHLCNQKFKSMSSPDYNTSKNKTYSLFHEYIFGILEKDELYKLLQNSWQDIYSPAREYYFSDELNSDPDKYISLLFIAVRENFAWYPILFKKIKDYLFDKDLLNVIELLFSLKCHLNLYILLNKWMFSSINSLDSFNQLDIPGINATFSVYKNYGKFFTQFSHQSSNTHFKIDKSVILSYKLADHTIIVSPKLFSPPLIHPKFNYLSIVVNNISIILPLIWKQFFIQYNECKIKFILKKKRWQISFNINKNIYFISVDGNSISIDDKKYFSFNLENKVDGNIAALDVFDKYGLSFTGINKSINKVYLKGIGIAGNGLIIENFNVSSNKSAKNRKISTNQIDSEYITAHTDQLTLKASASKFNPAFFELNKDSGILNGIRELHTSELRYKLLILINKNLDIYNLNLITKMLYDKLRFHPLIQNISNTTINRDSFYIIIDSISNWEKVGNSNGMTIVKFPKSKQNAVLINKDDLQKELSLFFTCI